MLLCTSLRVNYRFENSTLRIRIRVTLSGRKISLFQRVISPAILKTWELKNSRAVRNDLGPESCFERGKGCRFMGRGFFLSLSLSFPRSFARDSAFAHFCNLCTLERVRVTSLTTARNFLLGFRQTGEIEIPVELSPRWTPWRWEG